MDHDIDQSQVVSDLADRRARVTRDAIVGAAIDLLADEHAATLSVPAVAEAAGVSVRTVYRYFPNKQALLDAVANYFPEQVLGTSRLEYGNLAVVEATMIALWTDFSRQLPAVRAQHRSPLGLELRQRRLTETRAGVAKAVAEAHPDTSEHDRERLVDLIIALTSSAAFLELTDRLGRDPTDAARLAVWAVRALNTEFARNGGMP
jgi:AcrR family transcriptional regulator